MTTLEASDTRHGMWYGLAALLILVAVVVAFALTPKAKQRRKTRRRERTITQLKHEYARLLQMPPKAARETTARVLREMARDYPDRSPEWHLRKLISDLQRHRQ